MIMISLWFVIGLLRDAKFERERNDGCELMIILILSIRLYISQHQIVF